MLAQSRQAGKVVYLHKYFQIFSDLFEKSEKTSAQAAATLACIDLTATFSFIVGSFWSFCLTSARNIVGTSPVQTSGNYFAQLQGLLCCI
jgi:predicted membrane channel-forming protein YqfA (hemolysin III family)